MLYPIGLLAAQTYIWGCVAVAAAMALAVNAERVLSGRTTPYGTGTFLLYTAAVLLLAGMTAVSALMLAALSEHKRGAHLGTIALETFMVCFGLFLTVTSFAGFFFGGAGAVLSLSALICLLSRPAWRFTRTGGLSAPVA